MLRPTCRRFRNDDLRCFGQRGSQAILSQGLLCSRSLHTVASSRTDVRYVGCRRLRNMGSPMRVKHRQDAIAGDAIEAFAELGHRAARLCAQARLMVAQSKRVLVQLQRHLEQVRPVVGCSGMVRGPHR